MELATVLGLVVALAGPALPLDRVTRGLSPLVRHLCGQAYLLGLVGLVLIVLRLEDRPAESLGWHGASWGALAWGLALAMVLMWVVYPLTAALFRLLRLDGYGPGLARLAGLPRWALVLAAVMAGIAEEMLYRGFALTRLAEWSGSGAFAALLTTFVFAAVHQRLWGWGAGLGFVISGSVLAAFFVWQGDLLANIIAHAVTDAVGLLRLRPAPPNAPGANRP